MSQAVTFKCPSCGAYLEFDPVNQAFHCPFCDASFDEATLKEISQKEAAKAEKSEKPQEVPGAPGLRTYHCQTCGAEIVTDETTAATRCYYCHNPVVLNDRLSEEFRPDAVIPFAFDRKQAEAKFEQYLNKKKYVDRKFLSKEQRENISGVYYPYWMGDIDGEAIFDGEGKRISVTDTPRATITTTNIYQVRKEGKIHFGNIIRQALSKNDRKLSDGIQTYNLNEMKPFEMGYLSGFLAEKRDVQRVDAESDMLSEAKRNADNVIKARGTRFDTLSGTTNFTPTDVKMRYCLLPAWVLTYRAAEPGKTYYFMMNGQTGTTCGRLPIKWSKVLTSGAIVGGIVCALLCMGGAFIW